MKRNIFHSVRPTPIALKRKMTTPAFSTPLPLFRAPHRTRHSAVSVPPPPSSSPRRRARPVSLISPLPTPPKALQTRSVITLRLLSDLSIFALLHELSQRLTLPQVHALYLQHDIQLLLGGLMGVWTASCLLQRLAMHTTKVVRNTRKLPDMWDSDRLYRPSVADEEMLDVVTWLCALNEVSGRGLGIVQGVVGSNDASVRRDVAERLARYGNGSNVIMGLLGGLCDDEDERVRVVARAGLQEYNGRNLGEQAGDHVVHNFLGDMGRSMRRYQPLYMDAWDNQQVMQQFSDRVETIGRLALTPRKEGQPWKKLQLQPSRSGMNVPLFEGMPWSEIHGLCALALAPMAYELLSIGSTLDLPLRFVGLGWLLTMGGFVAYPASARLCTRLGAVVKEFIIPALALEERAA